MSDCLPGIIGIAEKQKHQPHYGKWKKKKYLQKIISSISKNTFCDHPVQNEQAKPIARNIHSKHKRNKERTKHKICFEIISIETAGMFSSF